MSVTYLEDHTLFFDGALATMLGMCAVCGTRFIGAAELNVLLDLAGTRKRSYVRKWPKPKTCARYAFYLLYMVQGKVVVHGVQCWLL